MDLGIRGKCALVAGASSGIGFAVARSLAAEGARVALCSREPARVGRAAARIREEVGSLAVGLVGDLARPEIPARIVEEARERLGGLEILVTNAGGPPSGNFEDVSEEDFARAWELTFRSAERLMRTAIPHLRSRGWGRIVCLTSIAVREPREGLVLSNAVRPALHGLAKSLARELARDRITVNCVCTGFTDTERLRELAGAEAERQGTRPEEFLERWRAEVPRGELGRPEEIAAVVAFLCSEKASYVNGASIAVDGGESRGLL